MARKRKTNQKKIRVKKQVGGRMPFELNPQDMGTPRQPKDIPMPQPKTVALKPVPQNPEQQVQKGQKTARKDARQIPEEKNMVVERPRPVRRPVEINPEISLGRPRMPEGVQTSVNLPPEISMLQPQQPPPPAQAFVGVQPQVQPQVQRFVTPVEDRMFDERDRDRVTDDRFDGDRPPMWWEEKGYPDMMSALKDGWRFDTGSGQWYQETIGDGGDAGGDAGDGGDAGGDAGGDDGDGGDAETTDEAAKREQALRDYIDAISRGEMPEALKIPNADLLDSTIKDTITEMAKPTTVTQRQAAPVAPEEVTEVTDVERAEDIKPFSPAQYEAVLAGQPPEVKAAYKRLSPQARSRFEKATLTQPAEAATILEEEMRKVLTPEVVGQLRPESLVQDVEKVAAERMAPVADVELRGRQAQIITDKQKTDILQNVTGEGVNLEDIPQFEVAAQRTAQVGEANTRIAQELGDAPSADAAQREAITSDGIAKGTASQIGGVPTLEAASRQAVTGTARQAAAADMLAVVGEMPPEVTEAIIEDPATVEAQLDNQPVNVQAAVAALPEEALVSTQMEGLLAGIEENQIPTWARPAVDAVNAMMARRGLRASTVGRDALFNAIIQSALPIAQSNAQALQARATQNLSNEQQANLQQASQVMQQRMANLANRQTAASQTAQMAQQVKIRQAEFEQQAIMTTAQQEQQVRLQNLQNEQQRAMQESAQRQQTVIANLDAGSRMDIANLEQLNAAGRENLSAEQQARLTEYQATVARQDRQAELNQRMEEANLDAALKVELANLSELNATNRANMSAEQQTRLANLNVLVDFKKTNASLAQQMDLANMSAENQMELANLQEKAAADSANFTAANQFRLQELTTAASVLSQNAELRQRAEFAKLSAEEKIALANLTAKNQADSESMTADNQAALANLNKKMKISEVNAQLAQQMGLAELSFEQNKAMTNAQLNFNMDMANFNAEQQTALANSKFLQTATLTNLNNEQQAAMQNATALASLDMANLDALTKLKVENARNFLQMDLANLSNQQQANMLKSQQAQQILLSDQAAQNAARQFGAANEQQTNQFMASLANNINQFNAQQNNAMKQFNASQTNAAAARDAQREADLNKFNAQLSTQIDQFNANQDFARNQWNAQNEAVVKASNVQWQRQVNTADTAAQNAINMQNAQNAFNMSQTAMAFMWQELRDNADYTFRATENEKNRIATLVNTALASDPSRYGSSTKGIENLIALITKDITG